MIATTLDAIHAHAIKEFPREACGVVIVVKGKERYYECNNIAQTPDEHFILDPKDYARASDLGEIIAIVHSHPNASAEPSDADRVMCEATGLEWHIVSVGAEGIHDMKSFTPCGYEAPLIGRSFSHGVLDCYTLVQDYYRRELGIELPYFDRRDGWWNEPGVSLYLDNFKACGFEVVTDEPQIGDAFLIQIRSAEPNHAAIYIGNGQIIHHVMGRLSSRDLYDGYWQENTRMRVRYKGSKK